MIMQSKIYLEDMNFVAACSSIDWEKLRNKNILVTGGTGLIGSTLINALLCIIITPISAYFHEHQ